MEIPEWVGRDSSLLELVHSVCIDQIRKGDGYPVALAEAHELAVVRGAERDVFFAIMQERM